MNYKELALKAMEAREYAYVPYSNFKVGAAIVMEDGSIYTGCNIENASYGGTNCAERTAIFKAISEGHKEIKAVAVVGDTSTYTYPCGICRQVILEFATEDTEIIIVKNEEDFIVTTMKEILPGPFSRKDLNK